MRRCSQAASRLLALRSANKAETLTTSWPALCTVGDAYPQAGSRIAGCWGGRTCNLHSSSGNHKQPPPPGEVPLDPEHVNIGNENDKEIIRASDRGTPEGILEVVELHGEDFTEVNVATVFHELAKTTAQSSPEEKEKLHRHATFQNLIDMVVMGRRRYNVKHLANILRSLAQLDYDNDMVSDRLSQHIMDKLPKADANALVNLAVGLSEMEHSPSIVLFEAIQNRAVEVQSDFSKEEKSTLEKAFSKLGYSHDKISSELK